MNTLTMKTAISYELVDGEEVTKVETSAAPLNITVTEYLSGDASPERIAVMAMDQAQKIRQIANILCSKQ